MGLFWAVLQAQKGNTYFTELAERVEYGNYAAVRQDRGLRRLLEEAQRGRPLEALLADAHDGVAGDLRKTRELANYRGLLFRRRNKKNKRACNLLLNLM